MTTPAGGPPPPEGYPTSPPAVEIGAGPGSARGAGLSRRRRIGLAGLALVLLGVVALAAVPSGEDEPVAAGVGDCIGAAGVGRALAAPLNPGPAQRIGCAEPEAAYRVALSLDTAAACPSPVYAVRREAGPRGGRALCLTYAVRAGDCFVETPQDAGRFDCSAGPRPAAIKILRVLEGVRDPARCADLAQPDVLGVTVPEPATTFCYVEFGATGRILNA